MVGNSSAALREGAFLGTPAVSVGTQQRGRECGANITWVGNDTAEIADAIRAQIGHGRYDCDDLYGDGTAGAQIAEILSTGRPPVQKQLSYELDDLRTTLAAASSR